jgi:hypothetical protein
LFVNFPALIDYENDELNSDILVNLEMHIPVPERLLKYSQQKIQREKKYLTLCSHFKSVFLRIYKEM